MGMFGNEDSGLKIIKVKTKDLLEKIESNFENHCKDYETAMQGFIIDCEDKLKAELKSIKKGNMPVNSLSFEKPENHSKDYETIIDMLKMAVDEEIEITYEQFLRYGRDEWDWSSKHNRLTALYNSKVK